MSAPSQGTSGPGGRVGYQPAPERLVSGNHTAPEPLLTWLGQTATEQSVSNEIKRLVVRAFASVLSFRPRS